VEQFTRAVREPWGVMPSYTEQQLSDSNMRDLVAYFAMLPSVAEPARWRILVPEGAPQGQQLLIATWGCGQCHGPVAAMMRMVAGGEGGDYAWFMRRVYDHTSTMPAHEPDPRMGNYSRARVPEPFLQELWRYLSVDLGLRAFVRAQISAGVPSADGVTYTLTVENRGTPGLGLTAEDLSLALTLPEGATVGSTTGADYQGIRRDQRTNADMAVWKLAGLAPPDRRTYTITLSGTVPVGAALTGSVSWTRPPLRGGAPDTVAVLPPPRPQ
jgi:mono/diheme cytochrome c family protein